MNIAENAAIDDQKTVAVFSLEIAKEALLVRMLCSRAKIDSHRMRTGSLWKEDTQKVLVAMEELVNAQLYIDDAPGISLSELRAKARRLQQATGRLDLVVIDYLQLMSAGVRRYENRTQEVSAISRGLKALAKELKAPVMALSQLSRAPETRGGDHRPQLADLRESDSIEQRCRRGDVYFPRGSIQARRVGAEWSGRNHCGEAAQWSHGQGAPHVPEDLNSV
jgi:replicative DNA helicase